MTDLQKIDYSSREVVSVLRNTVAQNATDAEFAMFVEYCRSTGLNPFKKEVWFIKTRGYQRRDGTMVEGKVQIMTGINGFLAIANRHPEYDGMENELLVDGQGKIMGATAKVYRKDRKFPSVATALMAEYYKPSPTGKPGIWEQMPSIMIAKCAKALALREAFPQELNGLYTSEEMPHDYGNNTFGNGSDLPVVMGQAREAQAQAGGSERASAVSGDELPWERQDRQEVEPQTRAKETRYDIRELASDVREKAEEYLRDNVCKLGLDGIWTCPIKLEKLTSCIVG